MATNGEKGNGRDGYINDRSQFQNDDGKWVKRDTETGQIMGVKKDGKPWKDVRKEKK